MTLKKPKNKLKRVGVKPRYNPDVDPKLAEAYAMVGGDNITIAKKLEIAVSTLNEWRKKYPELSDAIKKGKHIADSQVISATFKRAIGYQYTEVRKKTIPDPDRPDQEIVLETITTIKEVPGDTTAQIFWLKCRDPENWRDRQQIDTKLSSKIESTPSFVLDPETARKVGDLLASRIQPPLDADSVVE